MKSSAYQEFVVTPPDLRKAWLLPGLTMMAARVGMAFRRVALGEFDLVDARIVDLRDALGSAPPRS